MEPQRQLLAGGRWAAMASIAALALHLPILSACSAGQEKCPDSATAVSDLTLMTSASLVGKTVMVCTISSNGDITGPTQFQMIKPWDELLAVDGISLPSSVNFPGADWPADCSEDASEQSYLQIDNKWTRIRSIHCGQLD